MSKLTIEIPTEVHKPMKSASVVLVRELRDITKEACEQWLAKNRQKIQRAATEFASSVHETSSSTPKH